MTTVIRAGCTTCGPVDLHTRDVDLTVSNSTALSVYTFTCPICAVYIVKPASPSTIALLLSGGVLALLLNVPDEALESHSGPALTADDVLDFINGDVDTSEMVA